MNKLIHSVYSFSYKDSLIITDHKEHESIMLSNESLDGFAISLGIHQLRSLINAVDILVGDIFWLEDRKKYFDLLIDIIKKHSTKTTKEKISKERLDSIIKGE